MRCLDWEFGVGEVGWVLFIYSIRIRVSLVTSIKSARVAGLSCADAWE